MDNMTDAQFYDPQMPVDQPPLEQPMAQPPAVSQEVDIVGVPIDQKIDQEIADMVTSRQVISQQWRDLYRQEWDQATDHYEQVYNATGKESWQSKTFQPMTTTYVERGVAALHNMSMGPETPCEFKARNQEDEQEIESTNEIVQHDLEKSQFKVQWTDFLRTLTLYGTGIGKVDYVKEEATVMVKERRKPMLGSLMAKFGSMFGFGDQPVQETEQFVPQKRIVKDYAQFKNCDIYKIFPQPHIQDFSKDTWVIEKFTITSKELLEGAMKEDPYERLENVTAELLMHGDSKDENDPQTQQKRMAQLDLDVPAPMMEPDLKHEGLEYWGPVPLWYLEPESRNDEIKKYQVVNAWIWVIDGKWVVRKKPTPHMDAEPPYVKANYIRRPGQFYGIGVGGILEGLQVEKNEIRNTRADNINLILNKIIAVLKDKVNKDELSRLVSGPGAVWPFSMIDDIRKAVTTIDFPDITADSWRGSAEIDREAQEATDIIKNTQTIGAGEDQAGNGTFRGQMLNQQKSGERFALYARILEIVGLNRAIEKIYQRIYQYKKYDQIDKILGQRRSKDFELIPPQDLFDKASLISLGALTNENKGVKLAQMRDFYVLASTEPFFKKLDYLRKMYRLGGIGSDPDEVLWSDEEMQIYNETKRQMLQLAGAGATPSGEPPMPEPNGMGSQPSGPISGGMPGPMDGMPRPPQEPVGAGVSPMDVVGRPA